MKIQLWPGEAPDTALCGDQAQPSLDPYPVEGSRGAVIVCPGGSYQCKVDHEGAPVAQMISKAGISAYVLDYRVMPFRIETALGDALRAIRLLRAQGYEKVAILGFSAGGHLAASAATLYDAGNPRADDPIERLTSRPDAFISCYGATSLRLYKQTWARQVLGEDRVLNPVVLARYSAEMNITPDTPPAFLWHTSDDLIVPVESTLRLAAALNVQGVSCEVHIYPHGRHGIDMANDDPVVHQWCAQALKWLANLGFGKG